jgi:hypothetical protein
MLKMVELAGILHDYKVLNRTQGRCLICNEISECEITIYKKSYHILYIPIKRIEEQFLFDWEKCGHRTILHEKQDVDRYKEEQMNTGILNVPYYFDMKPLLTTKPKYYKPNIFIVIIISIIFAIIVGCIIILLGIKNVIII